MRRYGLFGIWLLGILFPLAWLGHFSVAYQQAFDATFAPETMHVLMHLILYTGLITTGFWAFQAPVSWRSLMISLVLVVIVGVFQELFQAWSNDSLRLCPLAYDLMIDVAGGFIGLVMLWAWQRRQRKA